MKPRSRQIVKEEWSKKIALFLSFLKKIVKNGTKRRYQINLMQQVFVAASKTISFWMFFFSIFFVQYFVIVIVHPILFWPFSIRLIGNEIAIVEREHRKLFLHQKFSFFFFSFYICRIGRASPPFCYRLNANVSWLRIAVHLYWD